MKFARSYRTGERAADAAAGYGERFARTFGNGVCVEIHKRPTERKAVARRGRDFRRAGDCIPGKSGVRVEDVIVATESGSHDLMNAPKELLIL